MKTTTRKPVRDDAGNVIAFVDQTPVYIYCTVCGRPGGLLALSGPCLDCTRARARAAHDHRCRCTRALRRPSYVRRVGSRTWTDCLRCLGTIAQHS